MNARSAGDTINQCAIWTTTHGEVIANIAAPHVRTSLEHAQRVSAPGEQWRRGSVTGCATLGSAVCAGRPADWPPRRGPKIHARVGRVAAVRAAYLLYDKVVLTGTLVQEEVVFANAQLELLKGRLVSCGWGARTDEPETKRG